MSKEIDEGYNRVMESSPELLDFDPKQFLKEIVAISYHIGVRDGVKQSEDIIDKSLRKLGGK